MKFAHIADAHLGGWREPKMRDANTRSFVYAIDRIIEEKVDFLIIAGDLFNTSMPAMDCLKTCVQKLKEAKDVGIRTYIIPGSHDYSPSGKTILDVLEEAGIFRNVMRGETTEQGKLKLKFTTDEKTGAKLVGMFGKRGGLEKKYYEEIESENLESEQGMKIFVFHSSINELKPSELADMHAIEASLLPKGFEYYAGGHVHIRQKTNLDSRKNIVYPGPVFPNSFSEVETLKHGSFVIYDNGKIEHVPILIHKVISIDVDVEGKSAAAAEEIIAKALEKEEVRNVIVTIRASGTLSTGRQSDINFNQIITSLNERGAYSVLKNTNKLSSREFEQVKTAHSSAEEIENSLILELSGKSGAYNPEQESLMIKSIMRALSIEKDEGEKTADFNKRIIDEMKRNLI